MFYFLSSGWNTDASKMFQLGGVELEWRQGEMRATGVKLNHITMFFFFKKEEKAAAAAKKVSGELSQQPQQPQFVSQLNIVCH